MRLVVFFVFLIGWYEGFTQLTEPVFFKTKTYDFGEVLESGGNADYEFTFTNMGNRPMRILTVNASCGCTTPGWTKDAVAAGSTGFVKVSFDPKGKPGYFNKTLTVTTDADKNPVVLTIKGNVVDKKSGGDELKVALGNLRIKSNSFTLGKVYVNKPVTTHDFKIQNVAQHDVHIKNIKAPGYIKVDVPKTLKPDEIVILKLKYDAGLLNKYGFVADRIELITSEPDSVKTISVYATAEEFFPTLTAAEMLKAPVLYASEYALDFARVQTGTKPVFTVTLQNKGKQSLQIRELQPNCTCLSVSLDKKTLKPNESATLKVTLTTEGRAGTQNKSITIYSTDPRNPVQRITVSGFIEQ